MSSLFDVTADQAISDIKSSLISNSKNEDNNWTQDLNNIFRALFNLPDIEAGFLLYNEAGNTFEKVFGKNVKSYILNDSEELSCSEALCQTSYNKLLNEGDYFSITNVDRAFEQSGGIAQFKALKDQDVKSAIFAPISSNDKMLGILELVSKQNNALNSINAQKLEDVMPFIVMAVTRSLNEYQNLLSAVIQKECTTVHPAVQWRFEEEAKVFIDNEYQGLNTPFKEIVFKNVNPLYGQIDIKNSSNARNSAIQKDLIIELSEIKRVLEGAITKEPLPVYEELIFRINSHINDIKGVLYTNSEQAIVNFVKNEVLPTFEHLKKGDQETKALVEAYEKQIDPQTESYYDHRRNYDESVMKINKVMAAHIDKKQLEAQKMYPHYFERYKTDGVEHNIYIGSEISQSKPYNQLYLNNLRLWQLQVMCEMENAHYDLKPKLSVKLDVASLILVYSTPLSIRFRLDEKQFDVDGTYNARYEIIKKRIDKSYIKGTNERLTQTGKLSIVYSQKEDELEYLRYIRFLQSKGYFTNKIEVLELDGLQGVSGLKAIRAEILYKKERETKPSFTYNDLMAELES